MSLSVVMFLVSSVIVNAQGETYDFIIVGGGTAGAVLANRLSEVPHWNILLLEAGKEPTNLTDIPAYAVQFQFTEYNWNYTMEPQHNLAYGMKNRRLNVPRGKVLGGSSILNFMLHTRGNRRDYDYWARDGNTGWSYQELLPYFKKSEDYRVRYQDRGYHSQGGYLGVEDVRYRSKCAHAFVETLRESGYEYVDYNGREQTGVSYIHATTRNGRRSSSVRAFLDPVRHRRNLKIVTEAMVTKLVISKGGKVIEGVEIYKKGVEGNKNGVQGNKNGIKFIARATKEVIVSAGAVNTPQILMLSGIGPKEDLTKLGIPLVKDSPVGKRLYDHPCYLGLTFLINATGVCIDSAQFQSQASLEQWEKHHNGPLTSTVGTEAIAYFTTNISTPKPDYPDVEYLLLSLGEQADNGTQVRKAFAISDEMYNAFWRPYEGIPAFTVIVVLMRPKSHGEITLRSRNPEDHPKIYGNYFTDAHQTDQKTMIAGIKQAIKLIHNSSAFKKYGAKLVEQPVPGCERHKKDSDDYWGCAVRTLTGSTFHLMGTSRMGPDSDGDAVLDRWLNVRGVEGVRVVDASAIPSPITGHINVPVYMMAEKGADLIKDEYLFDDDYYYY